MRRCFVHVDYEERHEPEHKVDRNLHLGRGINEPHDSVRNTVRNVALTNLTYARIALLKFRKGYRMIVCLCVQVPTFEEHSSHGSRSAAAAMDKAAARAIRQVERSG